MRLNFFAVAVLLVLPISTLAAPAKSSLGPLITRCTTKGTFAMTFDDGPFDYTVKLVQMLNKYNVTATFFVNGDNYVNILDKKYRAAVKFAYDSGHQIASHTWDHKDLAKLSTKAVKEEMTKLEPAFKTIIGKVPRYMRPPYGSINDGANAVITSLGYRIIIWTFDSEDCDHPTDVKKDMANYQANLKGLKAASTYGFIALEHDVYKDTALVFAEQAVKYVQSLGYKMVSVAECLGDKGHEYRA